MSSLQGVRPPARTNAATARVGRRTSKLVVRVALEAARTSASSAVSGFGVRLVPTQRSGGKLHTVQKQSFLVGSAPDADVRLPERACPERCGRGSV